jgi:hypothetical protein
MSARIADHDNIDDIILPITRMGLSKALLDVQSHALGYLLLISIDLLPLYLRGTPS